MGQNGGVRALGLGTVRMLLWGMMALVLSFGAQPAAARSFSSIEVEGNQRIEDATVMTYAGLIPGADITTGQINAALQRILASGLFETVDVDLRGSKLVFQVKEFPTVNRVSIEGNRRIDDELLQSVIRSAPRRVYDPSIAELDARNIAEAYRTAGRIAATVTPKIIPRSQNRVDIVFEITEGAVVEVSRIGFVGNTSFSDRRLRQVLGSKQAGLLRAVISRDTFVEDRIAFDRQALTDFYRSRGFIDFQVLSVSTEFSQDRQTFFVNYNIREGQRYRYGALSVASEVPELDAAAFGKILNIRSGQIYSPVRVDDNIARIERQILRDGIEFVQVEPRIERDPRNQTLDIVFTLVRGPRIFVERIDIEGNTNTRDDVIRRQFDTVEGDPLNPREIQRSASRIRALGFFAQAEVNTREGTASDRVIVDVDVEEQPTGSIGFGLNFSPGDGIGGTFSITERNFLGRGQGLSFTIAGGADNSEARISFSEPALFGRNVSGGIDLFYDRTENFSADYDTNEIGFSPNMGFRISEFSRLNLRYRLASEELVNVDRGEEGTDDNGSSAILQREEGERLTSSVGYTWTFDNRRSGLNPNAGFRFQFSQDFAGLGGDNKYIRSVARATAETRVWGEEIGLSATIEGGAINMLGGDNSRIIDRFAAGRRLRGFERNGIGPRDLTATNEDALGGNYYAVLRLESSFPIGLPEEYGLRGGLFFDAGSVWELDDVQGTGGEVDDSFQLRTVLGASIFWTSAIGPLRFDFAQALTKESYDKTQVFDFSISTSF